MFRFAAPLLISASALNDETSLMQGLKPTQQVTQGSDKSKAIANLMSTATSMLKSGATTDVVEFAQATLDEITSEILPAINLRHLSDQDLITSMHARFQEALDNLEQGNTEIARLSDQERFLSTAHKECRAEEEGICIPKINCDYLLWELWKRFEDEEEDLRECSDEIEDHWCVEGANGTSWVFRDHAITLFPCFHEKWPIVQDWELQYRRQREICVSYYFELDAKSTQCNSLQLQLERAACSHAEKVEEVRVQFANEWFFAVWNYQRVIDEVHCLELDRWKEWKHLTTIQCLLNQTHDRNGRPCEETSDEIVTLVTHCEEEQWLESIEHLQIYYPPVPPFPPPCPMPPWDEYRIAVHPWPGVCVPQPPHAPCSPGWIEQEYADLWTEPRPDFHEPLSLLHPAATMIPYYDHATGNSHCNRRPECADCTIQVEPPMCASVYEAASGSHGDVPWIWHPTPTDECHPATRAQMDEGYWHAVFYQWFPNGVLPQIQYIEGAWDHSLYNAAWQGDDIVVGR